MNCEIPDKIQECINRLDNALFFAVLEFTFDWVDSGFNWQHADDADDDSDHCCCEIIKKCAASHATACSGIQLRQTYTTNSPRRADFTSTTDSTVSARHGHELLSSARPVHFVSVCRFSRPYPARLSLCTGLASAGTTEQRIRILPHALSGSTLRSPKIKID